MLQKIKKMLLLSDVPSFVDTYRCLAEAEGVYFQTEAIWNKKYRITADRVVLGSKYLDSLNESYYPIAVIILKSGESPFPYVNKGISSFIFNFKDRNELLFAMFRRKPEIIHASEADYNDIVKKSNDLVFAYNEYDFKFNADIFRYKGKAVYLTKAEKKYLMEWLLYGNKDNSRRMLLCKMRKRLGEDFLTDINRFGETKGGKNE